MRDFKQLDVWRKAHLLTLDVYRVTEGFPRAEVFGLSASLRRRSAAISMKIAESCGKDALPEYHGCLSAARGMGTELEYQLLLARDLDLIKPDVHDTLVAQVVEVRKMLSGLLRAAV